MARKWRAGAEDGKMGKRQVMSTANAFMWHAGDHQAVGNWRAGRWFAMCSVNTFKPHFVGLPAGWFDASLRDAA